MRIAVLSFDYSAVRSQWSDNPIDIGEGIAEMLVTELVKSGAYIVVERSKLSDVLREQKLQQSSAFDEETAVRIGRLVGVDAIICGSVTRFGTERVTSTVSTGGLFGGVDGTRSDRQTAIVGVDARLIDTETGVILVAMNGKGEDQRSSASPRWNSYRQGGLSFGDISQDLVGLAAERAVVTLVDQLIEYGKRQPRPKLRGLLADVDGRSVIANIGSEHGLRLSDKLVVERVVREVHDPANRTVILRRICQTIAFLTVVDLEPRACVARVDSLVPGEGMQVGQEVRLVDP